MMASEKTLDAQEFEVTDLIENIFEYSYVFFIYSPQIPDIDIIIRNKKIIYFVHGLFLFLQLQWRRVPSSAAVTARPESCGLVRHTVTPSCGRLHTLERSRTFLITHLARVTPEWVSSMSPRSLVMVAA